MDFITRLAGRMIDVWHNATPTDYMQLALAVILVGWYFSRVTTK